MSIVFNLLFIVLLTAVSAKSTHVCPIVLPVFTAQRPAPPRPPPSTKVVSPRVIDGRVPSYRATTYHVALSSPPTPSTRRCTATRLSKHWVLTAAHCKVTRNWTVSLSAPSIFGGIPARIEQVYKHPNYTSVTQRRFDIALIKVSPPPFEPPTFGTVKLNARSDHPMDEAFVRVSGFGKSTDAAPTLSNFGSLRFADIPVFPFAQCRAAYKQVDAVGPLSRERQLCAGYARGGCDACSGDSGGPLVQFDARGDVVQVAVVSAAKGCALAGFPGINARVDAVLPWMRSVGAQFDTGVARQQFRRGGINGAPPPPDAPPQPRPSRSATPTPLPTGAPVAVAPVAPTRTAQPAASTGLRPPAATAGPGPGPGPGGGEGGTVVASTAPWAAGEEEDGELVPMWSAEVDGAADGEGADDADGEDAVQLGEAQGSRAPRSPSDTRQSGSGVNVLALVLGVVGGAAALVAALLVFVLRR